jgi:general secretion pathway protein I
MPKFQKGSPDGGFTLIEVLVALTILCISLAIIFSIFSVGLRGRRAAEDYEKATMLAESKLSSLGADEPIREGETVGRFDDRFWWKTVVTPYREAGRNEEKDALKALVVSIIVSWGDGAETKSVALKTLRLVQR